MTLISAAREHEIEFIYAISPGLDITFSNPKEVSTLKRKLDQVRMTQFSTVPVLLNLEAPIPCSLLPLFTSFLNLFSAGVSLEVSE